MVDPYDLQKATADELQVDSNTGLPTAAPTAPTTLDQVKDQLRIIGTDQDDLLNHLMSVAINTVQLLSLIHI